MEYKEAIEELEKVAEELLDWDQKTNGNSSIIVPKPQVPENVLRRPLRNWLQKRAEDLTKEALNIKNYVKGAHQFKPGIIGELILGAVKDKDVVNAKKLNISHTGYTHFKKLPPHAQKAVIDYRNTEKLRYKTIKLNKIEDNFQRKDAIHRAIKAQEKMRKYK
jgi:hypothetical protein